MIIKTTKYFDKLCKKLISEQAREELFDFLEENPDYGDIMQGSGGVRKLRWKTGKNNKGKSGGARIIYYYEIDEMIILITIYSKNEKEDLSPSEKSEIKKLLPSLIKQMREE